MAELATPRDFLDLLKPRVMSLSIFTTLAGMVAAYGAGGQLHPFLALVSLLAIAVGAGASGALNMWWDADIDAVMVRTIGRPIPRGLVSAEEAATFGGLLAAMSVALLALASNYVAAGLLAFTIFFYVVIYSMWLKRTTPQNIVIGGAAGALPPVVGWAAISGDAPLAAWALFGVIFLWTPPHFWALALCREGDYARAKIPMMPNVAGEVSTRRQIFIYALLLAGASLALYPLNTGGLAYFLVALAMNVEFVRRSWKVLRAAPGDKDAAMGLFKFSIVYLFVLFAALLIENAAQLALG